MDKSSTETSDSSVQPSSVQPSNVADAANANAPVVAPQNAHTEAASAEATSTQTAAATRDAPTDSQSAEAPSANAAPASSKGDGDSANAENASAENANTEKVGEDAAATAQAPGDEDASKKKKKRRRRKKKSSAGQVAAPKNEQAQVPFLHLFEGPKAISRDHAFSAGEIVAGRVSMVRDMSIFVDLFGKATAVMDVWEPREVPPQPPPQEISAATTVSETAGEGDDAARGSAAVEKSTSEEGAATPHAVEPPSAAAARPAEAAPEEATREVPIPQEPKVAQVASANEESGPANPDISLEEMASASADVENEAEGEDGEEEDSADASAAEQAQEPSPEPPKLGTILRGRIGSVSESGTIAIVNRNVDRQAAKAKIEQARESRSRMQGLVFGFNRGGFDVLVEGIRVFCPANGMSLSPIANPGEYVGQRLDFSLPQRKGKSKGIVVSRRAILEREARKQRRERLKELDKGMVLDAVVTQVKDFGLFADVGHGLEGLVHQSELNWTHGTRPADVAKPGDTVQVKILDIKKDGKRLRDVRISLSMKALLPDPWDAARETVKVGAVVEGRVTNTTDFGAFIHLADGIEGLLHINELGKNLKHASHVVSIGEPVTVVIDRMDQKQRRISLSRLSPEEQKAVSEGTFDPASRPKSLKTGSHIRVVVERVEHTGVQVRAKGVLGKKGRGFIRTRDLGSWGSGEKRRGLAAGSELDVKVVGTERSGGLKLSVKGFENDAEREAVREYRKEASKQGFGTFGDLLRAKLETNSDS